MMDPRTTFLSRPREPETIDRGELLRFWNLRVTSGLTIPAKDPAEEGNLQRGLRFALSDQSLSITFASMASNMVWNRMRSMFRTYLALEERILFNLRLIYGGQNFTNAALLGARSPSIESDGNLDTKHDGFLLMAVPKKKTTPHKKKIRNRHRQLKNRTDIEICAICGNHKLENHLCGHCVERIKEETKKVRKERNEDSIEWPIPDILKQFRT